MIFFYPEHAKDISSFYLLNWIWVRFKLICEKKYHKGYVPYLYFHLFVYIFPVLLLKDLHIAVFMLTK